MDLLTWGFMGLFAGTFLAGTVVPFPSEALVIGAYELEQTFWPVIAVATAGNFIGGLTNYWIGYKSNSKRLKRKFNLRQSKINRWKKRLDRWGIWLGLLSWIPIIGDPMLGILGFYKVRFWPLAIMILIGKLGRYWILLWLYFAGFVEH